VRLPQSVSSIAYQKPPRFLEHLCLRMVLFELHAFEPHGCVPLSSRKAAAFSVFCEGGLLTRW
jgi:hypothetical protein